MLAVLRAANRDLGTNDPDYIITGQPPKTPAANWCLTVVIKLSDHASTIVEQRVFAFNAHHRGDRVHVHRVPPTDIPPPDQRGTLR